MRSRADRWLFAALVVLIVWLPLPWGSRSAAAIAGFGLTTATLVVWRLVLAVRGDALPPLPKPAQLTLALWLAWLAWGLLHALPLPAELLRVVAPAIHAPHAAVSALPGARASFAMSLLPGATLDDVVLGANYLGLFWLVLVTTARLRPRQRLVLTALVASGVAQALYGTVMTLSGWEYGFFAPKTSSLGVASGTFTNRNHFAGYLELTLAAGIALVLADLRPVSASGWKQALVNLVELAMSERMRIRILLAVMVIGLVLSRSRMGNIAFFTSLALCANVYVLLRNPKYFAKSVLFFVSLFAIDLLIVSESYGLRKLAERLEQTQIASEQRTIVFRDLLPLAEQYWVTGSGPGTFAAAFSPQRPDELIGWYDHAHNDHLQFLIEAGLPGYALLLALAGVTLLHAFRLVRHRRDPVACALGFAAGMGLVSLGIHGLADFNLRIPAVAATLVVLMALALSCSTHTSQAPPDPPERNP